jgi:hypothetical protein
MSKDQSGQSNTGLRKDPLWNFRVVGTFVPRATANAREKHGLHAAEIIINWPAIVGPALADYTAPRRIRWPRAPGGDRDGPKAPQPFNRAQKTTLEIWVAGGRAHEIPYLKASIISRINSYFGYRAITDIMPVDGPIMRPRPKPKARASTPAEIDAAAKAHAIKLDGDPLAEALAKLAANVARRRA